MSLIRQQIKRETHWRIAPTTKSGKPRTIEPPAIAFEYLRTGRVKQLKNRLKACPAWDDPDDLGFTNETERHYVIYTFFRKFKAISASIGRLDTLPHDLRHTTATVAISSEADIKSVQDMLGHATASFTLNVYARISETTIKDTAARMQSCYGTGL